MSLQRPLELVLEGIGATTLAYAGYKILDFASLWLLPTKSLDKYQRHPKKAFALITGASAGIGLGCAKDLAARGFNVILLGHKREELEEAKKGILADHSSVTVEIIVLDVLKASPEEIEEQVKQVAQYQITILINNVGGVPIDYPTLRYLETYDAASVDRVIDFNARFMAHLSRLMIPILQKNEPSLMINLSSGGMLGMPMVAMYSGTKGFVASISKALTWEAKAKGGKIDVLAILPGDVETQCNYTALTPGSPNWKQFGKCILDIAPRAVSRGILEISPYWPHALQLAFLQSIPTWLYGKIMIDSFEGKRKIFDAAVKKE